MKKLIRNVVAILLSLAILFSVSSCSSNSKGSISFWMNYNVENSNEKVVIVKERNADVRGVLDNDGNTIVPVKFDSVAWQASNKYETFEDDTFFFAELDGYHYVYNMEGKEILKSPNEIEFANPGFITNDGPFFKEIRYDDEGRGSLIYFYDKDGDFVSMLSYPMYYFIYEDFDVMLSDPSTPTFDSDYREYGAMLDCDAISKNCYLYQKIDYDLGTVKYLFFADKNGKLLNSYDCGEYKFLITSITGNAETDKYILVFSTTKSGDEYLCLDIDSNGNVISREFFDSKESYNNFIEDLKEQGIY